MLEQNLYAGKDLKIISDIMHVGNSLPIAKETDKMTNTLIKRSS